jgi:hypothetical protein
MTCGLLQALRPSHHEWQQRLGVLDRVQQVLAGMPDFQPEVGGRWVQGHHPQLFSSSSMDMSEVLHMGCQHRNRLPLSQHAELLLV